MDFKLTPEIRDTQLAILEKDGVDASPGGLTRIRLSINVKALDERLGPIVDALKQAELLSK
jgi:hypothetical protein